MINFKMYRFLLPAFLLFFIACDKGYQVRFTNYYTETIDTVIVGSNEIIFSNIPFNTSTPFVAISEGTYSIKYISVSKKSFSSSISIPGKGSGERTIQIDALQSTSILEE